MKDAAEAAAPPETKWGVIERSAAANNRAQHSRHDRAGERDDQVIGRLTTHLEQLRASVRTDTERLTLLKAEQRTRPGTGDTPQPRRRRTTSADHANENPIDPAFYEQNHDRGPEL